MERSGAAIVKSYLEKYAFINIFRVKKGQCENPILARHILSITYDMIKTMNYLILSNNANDFEYIKKYIRQQVASIYKELKKYQTLVEKTHKKPTLPTDFSQCINEAWFRLHYFEKNNPEKHSIQKKKRA